VVVVVAAGTLGRTGQAVDLTPVQLLSIAVPHPSEEKIPYKTTAWRFLSLLVCQFGTVVTAISAALLPYWQTTPRAIAPLPDHPAT
jgi:hypothetical protein